MKDVYNAHNMHHIQVLAMDNWKRDALLRLEQELRANLNLDDLLCRLEVPAGGFMTHAERLSVEEFKGQMDQVSKIVKILRRKSNKEFDTFLRILKDSGNELWASMIEESAQQFEQEYARHGKMSCSKYRDYA